MAIFRIYYTNLTGSVGWNPGDTVYYDGFSAVGSMLGSSQPSGTIPATGIVLISGNITPTPGAVIYPNGGLFTVATVSAYDALATQQTVTMRDPGTKFNIKLQNPGITGAYWGIKVTIQ